jgi:CO/xanthine dehydrogenase Mo-binding subunit
MIAALVRPGIDRERRVDGEAKVTGRMQYTADKRREGALWSAFVGSPFAYAKVRHVDVREASVMPGVRAIITGAEVGHLCIGRQIYDWPILARDDVRFIGDRVAAVAAETREEAEAAARAIRVEYDVLPPILDTASALLTEAQLLHPTWDTYHRASPNVGPAQRPHGNIQGYQSIVHGDSEPEAFFSGPHRIFTQRFRTPRQHCGYLEPHATLVWVDADDVIHVDTTHKMPYALRDQMANVLGIESSKIVVEASGLGGDFGGKGFALNEFPLYFLAKATGRAVRHVQTFDDELRLGTTRHGSTIELTTVVDEEGRFIAHRSRVVYDGGAYAAPKALPTLLPGYGYGTVPYHIPHCRVELMSVYTNTLPSAHMRGPAEIQTIFAWEQHIDTIARAMDIDPIEIRARNAIGDGQLAVNGDRVERASVGRVLETLRACGPRPSPPAAGSGRGFALFCGRDGGGKTAVRLRLLADGSLEATVGVPEQGAGAHTMVQRVIAKVLSVEPGRITVTRTNTADAPTDPGAGASRVTHIVGRAAQRAGELLADELRRYTSTGVADASLTEIARRACVEGPIDVVGTYDSTGEPPNYSASAYCIDVAVDRETGQVRVVDALLVVEVGEVINPTAHEGQLEGGFVFGLGCSLMEDLVINEDGRVVTVGLGDYKLPCMRDVVPLRSISLRGADGHGPFGAKMVGEMSNIGVAPAIANAVFDATGARITELPLSAERIYTFLAERDP